MVVCCWRVTKGMTQAMKSEQYESLVKSAVGETIKHLQNKVVLHASASSDFQCPAKRRCQS